MATTTEVLVRRTAIAAFRNTTGALLAGVVILVPAAEVAGAQVAIKRAPSGFNLFSVEQDVAVGQRAAAEIERQVQLATSARAERFLSDIAALLAAQAPGPPFPFRVSAFQSTAADALVLPGGPVFVSSALLQLARNEAEVAGLVAHALSHVVLRHGTERASNVYLARSGVSALGGLVGRGDATARIINEVGGFGPDAAFLSFGPSDEYEADALGAELMAKAGYDPVAMSLFFAALRREQPRLPALERFFSRHPSPPDREIRIRNLANVLRRGGAAELVGGFRGVRFLRAASFAPTQQIKVSTGTVVSSSTTPAPALPAPSTRFVRFSHSDALIALDYPVNWETYQSGLAVTFAPTGGLDDRDGGPPTLRQGAVVNYYAPFESEVDRWNNSLTRHFAPFTDRGRRRGILEDATDDLVRHIADAIGHLRTPVGSARSFDVDGSPAYSVRLSGRSPGTGKIERLTVYTRLMPDDQVVYLACASSGRTAPAVDRACWRMFESLRVTESAANRH